MHKILVFFLAGLLLAGCAQSIIGTYEANMKNASGDPISTLTIDDEKAYYQDGLARRSGDGLLG